MKPLYIAVICVVSVIVLGAFSANQYNGEFKNLKVGIIFLLSKIFIT